MTLVVSEQEFSAAVDRMCARIRETEARFSGVTGPGRSGAISAVYVSHRLGIPFVPYKQIRSLIEPILIVDTVSSSGKTLRKAANWYASRQNWTKFDCYPHTESAFDSSESERHVFWYESEYQTLKERQEAAQRPASDIDWKPGETKRFVNGVLHYRSYEDYCWD